MTVARIEFCKQSANGDWLIGLSMNRTQCRTGSDDLLVDPILSDIDAGQLRSRLSHAAASARIEAAFHLANRTDSPKAFDLHVTELDNPNQWAACRVARSLQLLGERARGKIAEMQSALNDRSARYADKPKGPRSVHTGVEFSLLTAFENAWGSTIAVKSVMESISTRINRHALLTRLGR